jgi:hypothetical protein
MVVSSMLTAWLVNANIGIAAVLTVVSLILVGIFLSLWWMTRGGQLVQNDASFAGAIILLMQPAITALLLGIAFQSLQAPVIFIVFAVIGSALALALFQYAAQIFQVIDAFRFVRRSPEILSRILPLLLIFVLLSLFSEEYWKIVASLPIDTFVAVTALVFLPGIVSIVFSVVPQVTTLIPNFQSWDEVLNILESSIISVPLRQGTISQEAWLQTSQQAEWRHIDLAQAQFRDNLSRPIWLGLILILLSTIVLLAVVTTAYFFVLLNLVVPNNNAPFTNTNPITLISSPIGIGVYSRGIALLKVSLLTATFVVTVFSVHIFSDEMYRVHLFRRFEQQIREWVAAKLIYDATSNLNFQFYAYIVAPNKKNDIINASLVVPQGLPESEIEFACESFGQNQPTWNRLLVTAFEQTDLPERYVGGLPSRKWQFILNRHTGHRSFQAQHFAINDLREDHNLGFDDGRKNTLEELQDGWFGNTPEAVELGKQLWEMDTSGALIMHPYIYVGSDIATAEIQLLKRLGNTDSYKELTKEVFQRLFNAFCDMEHIDIFDVSLTYRGHITNNLALTVWNRKKAPFMQYSDEHKRNQYIEPSDWLS